MSDRKLLTLFIAGVAVTGGLMWFFALTFARPFGEALALNAPPATKSSPQSAIPNDSSSPITTHVDTPGQKLERTKQILTPPLNRATIDAAKLIVSYIPKTAPEHKEGQRLVKEAETRLKADEGAEALRLRDMLEAEYQTILSEANPHLNYITAGLTKHKGGFALWGVHTYFTQYTFSIGNDAKVVSAWIDRNRGNLKKAGIVRVGVRSKESWGGSCWFDV